MRIRSSRIVEQSAATPAFSNARHAWGERSGLLQILEDERGARGIGEASPLPGYSSDTLSSCREDLARIEWSTFCGEIESLEISSPAARFAVETALLDLIGRREGVPISAVLNGPRAPVPLAALVQGEGDALLAEIEHALERGIRTVKLKVARAPLDRELEQIALLRRTFGEELAIRLDANQAWTIDQAQVALRELVAFGPELVEEPVPPDQWDLLDAPSPVLLALDESLQSATIERIRSLAARKTIAALVLKPMALGGFARCLELAGVAAELDLAAFVTHLFDGPVALAAAAELALSLPGRVLACGLDRHAGLLAWPRWNVPQIGACEIVPVDGPGLGSAK